MGDGVLAYFGWPAGARGRGRAGGPGRARRRRGGGPAGRTPAGEPLPARVGIATGLVVVGDLVGEGAARERGGGRRDARTCAARLQALAEPGTVVVAEAARAAAGRPVRARATSGAQRSRASPSRCGPGRSPARARPRVASRPCTRRGLTPLVGREQELALLLERWERAKDGEGQVVLLAGEPGIGKSRLVRALRERLAGEPHAWLGHYCSPYHTNSALHPVIGLLERAAGFARDDPPERRLDKLEAMLAPRSDGCPARPRRSLADLLAIPAGDRYPPLDLTPAAAEAADVRGAARPARGPGGQRPVLALYEDVHWVDPTTLELLDLVIDRVQRLPVLVVVTFRPEFAPPWTGHAHVTVLTLSRLGRRQGAAMVERVDRRQGAAGGGAGADPGPDRRRAAVRRGADQGGARVGPARGRGRPLRLAGPLPPLAIPATLQDSLMARLDRLAPAKEVAQVGGRDRPRVLATSCWRRSPALRGGRAASTRSTQLVAAELVFRRGEPPEASYTFKHALVQDAAYEQPAQEPAAGAPAPDRGGARGALSPRRPRASRSCWRSTSRKRARRSALSPTCNRQRGGRWPVQPTLKPAEHLQGALGQLDRVADAERREMLEFELQSALGRAFSTARGFAAPETGHAFARAAALGQRLQVGSALLFVLWGRFVVAHPPAASWTATARRGSSSGSQDGPAIPAGS